MDLSWSHILIVLMVALVVVGPKDLPRLMRIAGQLLPEPDRRRILQVRAADLHHVIVLVGLFLQALRQMLQRW